MNKLKVVDNFHDALALMKTGNWINVAWPYSVNDKRLWYFREINK